MKKRCCKCKIKKDIKFFSKNQRKCKDCEKQYRLKNKEKKKNYDKQYKENNKEKISKKKQDYYQDNKEKLLNYQKEYYDCNKEKISTYHKDYHSKRQEELSLIKKNYYQDNKEKLLKAQKEYYTQNRERVIKAGYQAKKARLKTDIIFKLKEHISSSIRIALKAKNISKQGKLISKYLSYTMAELKAHIERQFEPWMNWNNQGLYKLAEWNDSDAATWRWQLDHIIPQSKLPYTSMEDENFKKCWALDNLRPLSAKQNIFDGNRR